MANLWGDKDDDNCDYLTSAILTQIYHCLPNQAFQAFSEQ